MPKIVTFTANMLAETTYQVGALRLGKLERAQRESFQVGGKGLNVSRMLNRLGADNAAACFPGGELGARCRRWLEERDFELMAFSDGCSLRSGCVIRSPEQSETTVLGVDSVVSPQAVEDAVALLRTIGEPIVFAICGPVQQWDSGLWQPLRDWLVERDSEVRLAVDNYGPSLPWFLDRAPDFVKVNRYELVGLFSGSEAELPTSRLLELALDRFACERWIVTDEANPVWVAQRGEGLESFMPRQVDCVSATGCGDVFFATVLNCLYNENGYDFLEAAKLGAEYGTRNAESSGIAEFEL